MAPYTVASVPYLNAKPLVRFFEEQPDACPVRVIYDVPSRLPALLDAEEADAALVSSIEALTVPGRRFAEGLCIASDGPVESVRLFSKIPPANIKRLALDQSSLTSNALAQIVLAQAHGIRPFAQPQAPNLEAMLADHDAGILIGDNGLRQSSEGFHVLDLGEEWKRLTGLPFVWALWIGGPRLTPELVGYLRRARVESCLGARGGSALYGWLRKVRPAGEFEREIAVRQTATLAAIAREEGWPKDQVRRYLTQTICFDLGERELEALQTFRRLIAELGLAPMASFPEAVASGSLLAAGA